MFRKENVLLLKVQLGKTPKFLSSKLSILHLRGNKLVGFESYSS